MPTAETSPPINLPPDVQRTFDRSNAFLLRKYKGVAPSAEQLVIFYLAGLEPHEIVANLERQVLEASGKNPPNQEEHLLQTFLDMQKDEESNPYTS